MNSLVNARRNIEPFTGNQYAVITLCFNLGVSSDKQLGSVFKVEKWTYFSKQILRFMSLILIYKETISCFMTYSCIICHNYEYIILLGTITANNNSSRNDNILDFIKCPCYQQLQGSRRSLKTWKILEFENSDFCRGPWKS